MTLSGYWEVGSDLGWVTVGPKMRPILLTPVVMTSGRVVSFS
jgi:hypothetical protein